jgi:UDP-N-acetyl-D-glucosamine dehydrogenase
MGVSAMGKRPRHESTPHFLARLGRREVTIGVMGLGYTGLPLAVASARAGFPTYGYDSDPEVCANLARGVSHVEDVPGPELRAVAETGRFTAVASAGSLSPVPDVVFIAVPTPFAAGPDLSYVTRAARTLGEVIRPGMLVVAQSTSYPGTTTEVIQPLLEQGGLRAGADFALAFAPERIDPGNSTWHIHNTPRVVGGVNEDSTRRAVAVLDAIAGSPGLMRPVSSPAVAEFAKLLENSYRLVNIGLVNELAMLAHELGVDISEVIEAAASKPYGFQPFRPGVGPGGACIPEDPLFLAWKARTREFDTRLINLAAEQNQGMARYVFHRVMEMLSRQGKALGGSRVLCLGAGYKADLADTRHSRALRVMELLAGAGADLAYADALIPSVRVGRRELKSLPLESADPAEFDLVVVLVPNGSQAQDLARFTARRVPVFDAAHVLPAGSGVERLLALAAQPREGGGQFAGLPLDPDRLVPAARPAHQADAGGPDPEGSRHRAQRRLGGLPAHRAGGDPDDERFAPAAAHHRARRARPHPDLHRECHRETTLRQHCSRIEWINNRAAPARCAVTRPGDPAAGGAANMLTTRTHHHYVSGWCASTMHQRCAGSYAGIACGCACHGAAAGKAAPRH